MTRRVAPRHAPNADAAPIGSWGVFHEAAAGPRRFAGALRGLHNALCRCLGGEVGLGLGRNYVCLVSCNHAALYSNFQ